MNQVEMVLLLALIALCSTGFLKLLNYLGERSPFLGMFLMIFTILCLAYFLF